MTARAAAHERSVSPLVTVLASVVRWEPRSAVALFGLASAGSLVVVVAAALLKFVVEAVLASDWTKATLIVLGVAAMYAASVVISKIQLAIGFGMNERFAQHVDQALVRMAHGEASIEVLDSPNVLDQTQLLQQKRNYVIQSPYTAASLVSLLVAVLFTAALLVHVHPLMIGVAILAVPSIYLGRVRQTWQHDADRQYAGRSRALGSLFELLTSAAAAMEVRIFGLADELVRRYADLARQSDRAVLASAMRGAALNAAGTLVSAAGYAAGVLIALRLATAGVIGLGDVVLVLLLSLQLQAQISGATAVISLTRETGLSLDLLHGLRRMAAPRESGRVEAPAVLAGGIELDGVEYRYPERPEPALSGVSVSIPAGSVVALAGDNGAGKSTLASILAGLLEPTSGSVRIDDLPISEADIRSWRRRVGLAQQEFARFEFLAGQVIGVGDVERVDDQDAVWEAARAAAADVLIRSWPLALATPLGSSFPDGRQLSGGEWQRMALGRALMRRLPLVLVLDEPGANIDAHAERDLFERYMGTAREVARSTGAITVVISHRLSITAFADLVIFLEDGAVSEIGSPAELLQGDGEYAQLYRMQAAAYTTARAE